MHLLRCAATTAFLLLSTAAAAAAEVLEQVIAVPVSVAQPGGAPQVFMMPVTVVRERAAGRRPFLVLEHGRPAGASSRTAMGLQSFPANARYFAGLGFVVLVPTRIGYGVAGGPDLEYTGECADKQFTAGIDAAVEETRQMLAQARQWPHVDATRGLIVGESFGGLVAIASVAASLPGVAAAVDFAGGDGGDSELHVDQPCQPERLQQVLEQFGMHSRLPTLWLYSANDRVWGPRWPRAWFEAFVQAGGHGQFVALPADRNNGHYIFNRNPPAWQPAVGQFIDGLATLRAGRPVARSGAKRTR